MESESLHFSYMPPRTDRFEDEETSSLSDYDSEWTQVSGTEDDSDYPPLTAASDRPLSRADTIDGSVDGDVWEGFVDGIHRFPSRSSDETRPLDVDATDEAPQDAQLLSTSVVSRASEDEIVNDALNSSFVGTLRASRVRSATSSLHASLSESQSKLRLSFPDPLSSREDLDSDPITQDASTPTSSVDEHCENITTEDASSSFADIEAPSTLSVSETADEIRSAAFPISAFAPCVLSLFLYGSVTSSKWQIAERIMTLALQHDNSTPSFVEEGPSRRYYFDYSSLDDTMCAINEQAFFVRIVDRTSSSSEMELADDDDSVPSLAILLLPSRLPAVLPRHSFYLPLISPSSLDFGSTPPIYSSAFSEQVTIDSAHYTWNKLDLPKEDIIVLDEQRPNAIFDVSALESIHQASLAKAFSGVFRPTSESQASSKVQEGERLFSSKWYTFAFVAATLLAVTVGGIRIQRNSTTMTTIANDTSKAVLVNATSSLESATTVAALSIPSDHHILTSHSMPRSLTTIIAKSTARSTLTSIDRKPDSLSLIDVARGVVPAITESSVASTSSAKAYTCRSKARSWANKLNLSLGEYIPRDLIVRPVNVLGIGNKEPLPTQSSRTADSAEPSGARSGDKILCDGVKSLSLRAVHNSLAVVSSTSKALMEVAGKDMLVLYEAIDELLHALKRQVNTAKVEMKDAKSLAQTNFSFRNARAKENARRLRRVGEHYIKAAGKHLRSRGEEVINMASQVRESAKGIRQEAINSRQPRRLRRRKGRQMGNDDPKLNDGEGQEVVHEKKRGRNLKRHQRRMRRAEVNG